DGVSVCLASTAEEFVVQLERLLRDPQRAVQIGQAGRSLVLDHFRADAIAKSLLDAYRSWLEVRLTPQMPQVHG
ncbi:MAG: glycosyltransferase, partial [Saprospiraceae bacterium]|nr:glycosyltransferase [Saprospiraceae bacterium]